MQRGGRAAAASDDLAQVIGVHVHLDGTTAAAGHYVDPDIIRVVDDPADQMMLYGVDDDAAHSAGASASASVASAASVSAAASAASSFLSLRFFSVTASPPGARRRWPARR